tara:strand:- start:4409 stop:4543 length:135 start_codon:yes stop_codon:yes gene_type:complete
MANITFEGDAFEAMMKAAEEMDKTKKVTPQECSIDDTECLHCGS